MSAFDFIEVVEVESRRCLESLRTVDLAAPVPPCPGWTAADLAWHLAEVQYFWAAIVSGLLTDPHAVADPERPADSEVLALLEEQSRALVEALSTHAPEEACWSWYEDGHSVGWSRRRQAHEALIHRVDAELTAGREVTATDPELAADGVEEILGVMLYLGGWGMFTPDGARARIESTDAPRTWDLEFGRFTGTSPDTGRTYDEDATRLSEDPAEPALTVRGGAWDLDRWLWGRGGDGSLAMAGDRALADRLRQVITDSTQ